MTGPIRVGTRRSPLALAQTDLVIARLTAIDGAMTAVPVPITTEGDRTRARGVPLDFTDTIDAALAEGTVDLAVHSAKDLPARLRPSVGIVAVPRREDPRDCLILHSAGSLESLPAGARIGSSSLRRRAQLLRARPELSVVELRGNVDSRLRRVRTGELDGAMLAVAGLRRLGRASEIDQRLDTRRFLPPPGQGTLAVMAREGDTRMARLVRSLDHASSRAALSAERAFSAAVGGDCNLPLAALAVVRAGRVRLRAEVLAPDGRDGWSGATTGPAREAAAVGRRLAARALDAGVARWVSNLGAP